MNILMVWFHSFPQGNASSFRAYILSRMIVELGHKIDVIAPDYVYTDQNVDSINVISLKANGKSYVDCVEELISKKHYDLVIRSASNNNYLRLNKIFKAHGLPILLDSVEWFNASNWKLGYLDPRYYFFQILWQFAFPKANGVIAISRMIEEYYQKKTSSVVRIPTITDTNETPFRVKTDNYQKIRFVFIGMLDKGKDNLELFARAMEEVDPSGDQFELHIYGPNKEEALAHLYPGVNTTKRNKNVIIHGRVPQPEAREACLGADYNVFFRYNRRSANAGFPTKLGESMTMATPNICNDTGDISLVVKNGTNGFLLKTYSKEEIIEALESIKNMNKDEREKMRINARRASEDFFDYRNYLDSLNSLINQIV